MTQIRPFYTLAVSTHIYIYVWICPLTMYFFEAAHWPLDHMISLRPIIGQPAPPPHSPGDVDRPCVAGVLSAINEKGE